MRESITVKGAKEHNLKDIDIEIPRNQLVVITGVSGSGKSTLAFDTVYAEGQRRFLESLSAYSRKFVSQLKKPDVDFVMGLSPVISIEQKTVVRNPRSTVGTMTDIYDYLRMLFATIGIAHCPYCAPQAALETGQGPITSGRAVPVRNTKQMLERLLSLGEGTEVEIRAPVFKLEAGTVPATAVAASLGASASEVSDTGDVADSLHPPLTTMALPHYQMGRWAVDHLMRHLAHHPRFRRRRLDHRLAAARGRRTSIVQQVPQNRLTTR